MLDRSESSGCGFQARSPGGLNPIRLKVGIHKQDSQQGLRAALKRFLITIVASLSFSACSSSGSGDVLHYVSLGETLPVGIRQDPAARYKVILDTFLGVFNSL